MPTESTPVSGVAIKKAVVAPRDAPACFRLAAVGITEQEHRGSGAPMMDALNTDIKSSCPRCLKTLSCGIYSLSNPAMKKPPSSHGPDSTKIVQMALKKSIIGLTPCRRCRRAIRQPWLRRLLYGEILQGAIPLGRRIKRCRPPRQQRWP